MALGHIQMFPTHTFFVLSVILIILSGISMENYDHFSFLATVLFFSLTLTTSVYFALESAFISLHLMCHVCFSLPYLVNTF